MDSMQDSEWKQGSWPGEQEPASLQKLLQRFKCQAAPNMNVQVWVVPHGLPVGHLATGAKGRVL